MNKIAHFRAINLKQFVVNVPECNIYCQTGVMFPKMKITKNCEHCRDISEINGIDFKIVCDRPSNHSYDI